MRRFGKRFVYILRSDAEPKRHYVGVTRNVTTRLDWHNHGASGHATEHQFIADTGFDLIAPPQSREGLRSAPPR
jgi:hypothetical protein